MAEFKTDIQIAQECEMENIRVIAERAGVDEKYLEMYGNYKAKVDYKLLKDNADKPNGKLILVTAINPTPAGEGKTTTTVGLADGMRKIGKNVVVALREPSLGPVFGVKGGAAGGGYAQVVPMEDINLHFTGDFHAIWHRRQADHLEARGRHERPSAQKHRQRPRRPHAGCPA